MNTRIFVPALTTALAAGRLVLAADWPAFRGNNAHSGISSETLTLPLVKKWEFKTVGPLRGSPIVVNNAVIFGSCDHKVYCLGLATGKPRWTFTTDAPVEGTAAVADDLVCIGSDDGRLYALRLADGKPAWTFQTPGKARWVGYYDGYFVSTRAIRGGVLVQDGTAYFASGVMTFEGGSICAVSVKDGRLLWQNDEFLKAGASQDLAMGGAPTAAQGKLYLASGGFLAAFNLADGKFLWRKSEEGEIDSMEVMQGPDGLWIYGTGGYAQGRIYWSDYEGRKQLRTFFKPQKVHAVCAALPIDTGERLYVPVGYQVLALDRKTFFGDRDEIKRTQKALLWTSEPLGKATDPPIVSSPALAGDLILVGGTGRFVALGTDDGKVRWESQLDGAVTTSPAVSQGCVLIGTESGIMHCFSSSPKKP